MIVCHKHKFVYFNIPKTGTNSIEELFKKRFKGNIFKPKGRGITSGMKTHFRGVPVGVEHFDRIISVRNPYTRVLSMYNFEKSKGKGKNLWGRKPFVSYCEWVLKLTQIHDFDEPADSAYRYFSCSKYGKLNGWQKFIRMENLIEDINGLGYGEVGKIPHINPSHGRSWDQVKTPEIIEIINEWADDDFELFGYQREEI